MIQIAFAATYLLRNMVLARVVPQIVCFANRALHLDAVVGRATSTTFF